LIDAAVHLLANGGADALTIAAVTESADVGFGTFYGYFADKDALIDAVLEEQAEARGRLNDALTDALDDPAEVMAAAIRLTLAAVQSDDVALRLQLRLPADRLNRLHEPLQVRMRRDLVFGERAGRFSADPNGRFPVLISGMVSAAVQARVAGRLPARSDVDIAADVLRLVGIDAGEATEIARRSLPSLSDPVARARSAGRP
jgi:AcrR family transcriptional regulator